MSKPYGYKKGQGNILRKVLNSFKFEPLSGEVAKKEILNLGLKKS